MKQSSSFNTVSINFDVNSFWVLLLLIKIKIDKYIYYNILISNNTNNNLDQLYLKTILVKKTE